MAVDPLPSSLTCTALQTAGGVGQVALAWENSQDECLNYLRRLVVEVHAATTNNREAATKVGESGTNLYIHNASRQTRYYWIRVRNVQGGVGPWYPESPTGGISGIPSQAGSADIGLQNGKVDIGTTPDRVFLDAGERRITVNDGVRDRVRIGDTDGSGTYGIITYDASGNVIFSSTSGPGSGFTLPAGQVSGLGLFASLNQINSGNAATYIANAAIGNALIGELNANKVTTGTLAAINISGVSITGSTFLNAGGANNPIYLETNGASSRPIDIIAVGSNALGVVASVSGANAVGLVGSASGSSGIGVEASAGSVSPTTLALLARALSSVTSQAVATITAQSTSYASSMLNIVCGRSASAAFEFAAFRSGGGSDNEFRFLGDGNAFADGSWTGGGAGIAHWLESDDGDPIPVGTTVLFSGGETVRAATQGDDTSLILGVVAPPESCAMLANSAWNRWHEKYLTDDFGGFVLEDYPVWRWQEEVEVPVWRWIDQRTLKWYKATSASGVPEDVTPIEEFESRMEWRETEIEAEAPAGADMVMQQRRVLNPDFDPAADYIPRADRPEWHAVKHRGRAAILKGQPVNPRWRLLREISANVDLWWVD